MTKKSRNILILVFGLPMIGIGIFSAMVVLNVYNRIQIARAVATQKGIEEIRKAATIYQMQHAGRLPDSIADLTKESDNGYQSPLLKSHYNTDSWGTPYQFKRNGRKVAITSAGRDKKFGTKDDVTNLGEP